MTQPLTPEQRYQLQLERIEAYQRGQVQAEPQYLDDVPDWEIALGASEGWE